jgi:hypothetical protein
MKSVKLADRLRQRLGDVRFLVHDFRLRSLRRLPLDEFIARLSPVIGAWPDNGDCPQVFSICDPPYFRIYVEPLVASMEKNSPGVALHLHLCNPAGDEFDKLARLQASYPHVQLTHTAEQMEFRFIDSIRFIRLYSAVRQSRRAMLAMDVDCLVRAPLSRLIEAAGDADVGLLLRPDRPSRMKVLGSLAYMAPTEAGLRFFETLGRHLAVHVTEDIQTDKQDQRILGMTYLAERSRTRIWEIPKAFSDWTLADDSAVWHGKGKRSKTEKFLTESRSLMSAT